MCTAKRKLSLAVLSAIGTIGVAAAQGMPKEGHFETISCWSGTNNAIAFSKTHAAIGVEFSGTTRSIPAGGFLDMTSFHCLGLVSVVDGKSQGNVMCEVMDKDGDRTISRYVGEGTRYMGTVLAGTGKYEGLVATSTAENLGPFPVVKPGTFQNCNHATGTYRMK